MKVQDIMILAVLAVAVIVGILSGRKHFKGGGCCGGSSTVRSRKKLTEPKLGEKYMRIEGMHCENCQARIENALNRLDGVACKVNLRKKTATVSYSAPVDTGLLKETVERLGYKVTEIR